VPFIPWNRYNIEDSVILCKHMIGDGVFISIHI
jgi:DNA-directed RNA polymerase beta subunit